MALIQFDIPENINAKLRIDGVKTKLYSREKVILKILGEYYGEQ